MITTHAATRVDFETLFHELRDADREEVLASRGYLDGAETWRLVKHAKSYAVVDDDCKLICIYGCTPHEVQPEVGVPWLLGTARLDQHGSTLCRRGVKLLREWHNQFPILTNMTDKRNTVVLRWLRWLGFHFVRTVPVGPNALPFIQFVRHSSV